MLTLYLFDALLSILARYPVILPEPEQWEKDLWEVQDKIEAKRREVF